MLRSGPFSGRAVVLAAGVAVGVVLVVVFAPLLLVELDLGPGAVEAAERARLVDDRRGTLVQGITGLAILAGAWTTWQQFASARESSLRQLELAHESAVSQSLVAAVEQLAHDEPAIRVGGIMTLGRLAAEMPAQLPVIDELLAAHVRQHAPWPPADGVPVPRRLRPTRRVREWDDELPRLAARAPDIQAALTVLGAIGRRRRLRGVGYLSVDLSATDLRRCDLNAAVLVRVRLRGACLWRAGLGGADLRGADLLDTDLRGAYLEHAVADITTWWPDGFDPAAAGVRILDHLRAADLRAAWLDELDLTGVDLTGAVANEHTLWPPGFDWQAAGVIMTGIDDSVGDRS